MGCTSRGVQKWKQTLSCQEGSSLIEGFRSQGERNFATNVVLSRGINSDGGTHFEGYKGGHQALSCQEGSTLMEGPISRGTKVANKLCLVKRDQL